MSTKLESRAAVPRRHSLRWRLPFLVCSILLAVLAAFLTASYREVEATLLTAGGLRAQNAGRQVANLLAVSARQALDEVRRRVDDPAIRALFDDPSEDSRARARASLAPLAQNGPRRIELWTRGGERILEIVVPGGEGRPAGVPAGHPPSGPGLHPLHVSDELVFADVVAEVRRGPPAANGERSTPLGYLTLRSALSIDPPGILSRMVGPNALLVVGNRSGGRWTDLSRALPPPPVDLSEEGVAEYSGEDGKERLGALVGIAGTPWAVWVELDRANVVAPASAFLQRMIFLAAVFVTLGALLVTGFTVRFTAPLGALSRAAAEIAAGDYSRRVPATRRDEVGRLSSAFNAMALEVEQAYEALKETHEHTQFALAAARIGVWEVDLDRGRIRLSETMEYVLGIPARDFDGTRESLLSRVHPEDRGSLGGVVDGGHEAGDVFDVKFRAVWPDESVHWIEGKGRVLRGENGRPVSILAVSIDVTERRHLQALFTQAQKMEAVGQLAGGVAHDFNNLLTAILGYGNLILEEIEDGGPREEILEILKAGEMAASLTRQLLAFSRRQVLQPSVVSVNRVVSGVEKLLRRLIGEDIDLVTALADEPNSVRIDPVQLEQVIVNLALNSRDALPDGGRLTIETGSVLLSEEYCREHPSVSPGRHVLLSVSDTGVGMDAETQSRLFEPFFTTKGQGRGTGLGLAMVYGIVKQSDGHIYVYSEPGRGTTFKLYLPAADRPAVDAGPADAPELTGGTETILVVEDNDSARALASSVLDRLGYRILAAASGEDVLSLLHSSAAPVHLLVSDVIMPGMTGPELAHRLSDRYPEMKVLFTSGYSDDAIVRHGVLSPGAKFLQKPYTPAVLARKVRQALDDAASGGPAR